jgi:hypothetical protein
VCVCTARPAMQASDDKQDGRRSLHVAVSGSLGALAGAASKTLTAPVERIRLLLQMQAAGHHTSSSASLFAVLRTEGVAGLWRGNGLAVARAMLQKGLIFGMQDRLRLTFRSDMAAGAMAGLVAGGATYPLDLLRTRHAGSVGGVGLMSVARDTVAKHGLFALWSGAWATLVGGVVFEGMRFGLFGWLQQQGHARDPERASRRPSAGGAAAPTSAAVPPIADHWLTRALLSPALCGMAASICAGNVIYPNDTIRRRCVEHPHGDPPWNPPDPPDPPDPNDTIRRRLQSVAGSGETYASATRSLIREGGVLRLYRGFFLYNMKAAPSAAVQFYTYHELKRRWLRRADSARG